MSQFISDFRWNRRQCVQLGPYKLTRQRRWSQINVVDSIVSLVAAIKYVARTSARDKQALHIACMIGKL